MKISHLVRVTGVVGVAAGVLFAPTDAFALQIFQLNVRYLGGSSQAASCLRVTVPTFFDPLADPLNPNTPFTRFKMGGTFCLPYKIGVQPPACFGPPEGVPRFNNANPGPNAIDGDQTDLLFQNLIPVMPGVLAPYGENVGWNDNSLAAPSDIRWLKGAGCADTIPNSFAVAWFLPANLTRRFTSFRSAAAAPAFALALDPSGTTRVPANGTLTQSVPALVPAGRFAIVTYDTLDPTLTDGTVSTTTYMETDAAPAGGPSEVVVTFTNNYAGGGAVRDLTIQNVNYAIVSMQIPVEDLNSANPTLISLLRSIAPPPPAVVPALSPAALIALGVLLPGLGIAFAARRRQGRPSPSRSSDASL